MPTKSRWIPPAIFALVCSQSCPPVRAEAIDLAHVDACKQKAAVRASTSTVIEHTIGIDWQTLLVTAPDERSFYIDRISDSNDAFLVSGNGANVRMTLDRLLGRKSLSDADASGERVFSSTGRYSLYFADNVETERDNASWCAYFIEFDAGTGK
jgi:hypothetical protein